MTPLMSLQLYMIPNSTFIIAMWIEFQRVGYMGLQMDVPLQNSFQHNIMFLYQEATLDTTACLLGTIFYH